jgi:hypothetical protein
LKPDLAVTVSCGDDYAAMAELVVPRVQRLLGVDVAVVPVEPVTVEGSRADTRRARMRECCERKLELLRLYPGKRVMFFDLDWVPLWPWDWAELAASVGDLRAERAFVGVRQQICTGERHYDGGNAINGGFWIASPEHAPIFADALARWREQGDPKRWGWEEIFLNQALDAAKQPVAWLPSQYNQQCKGHEEIESLPLPTRAAHVCFARDKLAAVRAFCERYPLIFDTEPAPPPSSNGTIPTPRVESLTADDYRFAAGNRGGDAA